MKQQSLWTRVLGALGITVFLLFDSLIWQHHRLSELPLWIWPTLLLSLLILVFQWPLYSRLRMLRSVPLGWRTGMLIGSFMFLFSLINHPLPRPDWGYALFLGLAMGLFLGYVYNQSYSAKAGKSSRP